MREFGSEFPLLGLSDNYFDTLCSKFHDYDFLRSGRDALKVVSRNIFTENKCILLPAYCCESMIMPFIKNGWQVHFYKLNADLTINNENMISLIRDLLPKAVLVMNFFGLSHTRESVDLIKREFETIVVIEDFTHCLFDFNCIYNSNVDYYIASIRKWIGITDGAIILSKTVLRDKPSYKTDKFVENRKEAQTLKKQYLINGDAFIKENYRQKLHDAENYLSEYNFISKISPDSFTLLNMINVADIQYARQQNAVHLFNLISNIPEISFPLNINMLFKNTPFSLPILVEQRDEIQKAFSLRGLYAPLLWVINDEARQIFCTTTELMERKMLSLPIDQRYVYEDMEEISSIIHSVYK
jgi:hypothetical protein